MGLSRLWVKALGIYPLTFHTDLAIVICKGKISFVTQTGAEGIMSLEALNPISHFEGWGFFMVLGKARVSKRSTCKCHNSSMRVRARPE
jgi:hypothetical protein